MQESLLQVLNRQRSRLGAWENPSSSGWINWERCPFKDHRKRWVFGINPKRGTYKCLACGKDGYTKDIGFPHDLPRLARRGLAPRRRLAPSPVPEEVSHPWARLTPRGPQKVLERHAINYLRTRGITRLRAATLGIGYGTEGKWVGYVIHPFFDDDGRTLRGWQGRVQGDPEEGEPKVRTTSPKWDGDWVWGGWDGALYLYDHVPDKPECLVITEGPYDALSVQRVTPAVALLGSEMSDKQMARILKKRPHEIIVGLDPDKRDNALKICRRLFKRTHAKVFLVEWPENFQGDWAAVGNGKPRCQDFVYELVKFATREFTPGM